VTPTALAPSEHVHAHPFVKWAGGKRQLLPELRWHVPTHFKTYYEPFVGGGALFFDLFSSGARPSCAVLADSNVQLIQTYRALRDDVEAVIRGLTIATREYTRFGAQFFYDVRAQFPILTSDLAVATSFLFLNRTCFNGLYRVNQKGKFNVPHGRYENPRICNAENLRACSQVLQDVALFEGDFEDVVLGSRAQPDRERNLHLGPGDFLYFDPPYWPAGGASNFTSFTKERFGPKEQERLRDVALRCKSRGARVALSNADVPEVRALYAHGFELRRIEAKRAINSNASRRGNVGELLIW
jgi:DNA adenine methylase